MLELLVAAFKADAIYFLNTNSGYINRDQVTVDAILALINSTEMEIVEGLLYGRIVIFSENWVGQMTIHCDEITITTDEVQTLQDQWRAMIPGFVMGLMYKVDSSSGI